jgi:LacI family transcriptional regulator
MGREAAALLDRLMHGEAPPVAPLRVRPLGVVTRQSTDVTAIVDPVVAQAVRFIRERACEGIGVKDVVGHLRISRSVLQRRFRASLRRSIYDIIAAARVARVKELLGGTGLPLAAISQLAGFKHVEHLCAFFKQRSGQTPGEFRKEHGSKVG